MLRRMLAVLPFLLLPLSCSSGTDGGEELPDTSFEVQALYYNPGVGAAGFDAVADGGPAPRIYLDDIRLLE